MVKKISKIGKPRSLVLLGSEILFILSSALWESETFEAKRHIWLYYIVFCAGGYLLAASRKWLFGYGSVFLCGIVFVILGNGNWLQVGQILCFSASHIFMLWAVVQHSLLRDGVPAPDRILAGVAGYILLGFFWNTQCDWAFLLDGHAFINQLTGEPATSAQMLYFNFVTLTTLGYGDVLPATSVARVVTIFNSLSGVLYIAILISSLVGGVRNSRQTGA